MGLFSRGAILPITGARHLPGSNDWIDPLIYSRECGERGEVITLSPLSVLSFFPIPSSPLFSQYQG